MNPLLLQRINPICNIPSVAVFSTATWAEKPPLWLSPATGTLTSTFGMRPSPIDGDWEFHDGIDIALEEGTPLVAVQNGTITAVYQSPSWGNVVEYETEAGYLIFYAHLSASLVQEGEAVAQGQTIAHSGNTGRSTGAHLHYGIFQDGQAIDPLPFYLEATSQDAPKDSSTNFS